MATIDLIRPILWAQLDKSKVRPCLYLQPRMTARISRWLRSSNWPTARADTPERKGTRQQFIQELLAALPIYPVTVSLALRVGQIDGENQAKGIRVPLADLLIGVTALELDYGVATANPRHFERIPGLSVVRF